MQRLRREIAVAAQSNAKVLITGESGAGKDLTARVIHDRSNRRSRPFCAIGCSSVPDTLLESELFGHLRGSFSGAVRDHRGHFESANTGTVVLDEIGDSSPRMQGLLLRFLQFGELQRIGESGIAKYVDVRVIATTNRNLLERVGAGAFRLDLYYRLNVIPIHVPPLRDRLSDLPQLVEHFLAQFRLEHHMACAPLGPDEMVWLAKYHWPGNVRELRNAIERYVIKGELGPLQPGLAAGVGLRARPASPAVECRA